MWIPSPFTSAPFGHVIYDCAISQPHREQRWTDVETEDTDMIEQIERTRIVTDNDLRRLVVEDPVRPGPVRVRVTYADVNVPVWTLIGQLLYAYKWDPDSKRPQVNLVAQVAKDYAVPVIAVEAAILYYQEHRGAIESWLEENEGPRPQHD